MNQLLLIILAALQFAVFLILMLGKLFIRSIDPKGNLYSIDKWDKALIVGVILCIGVTASLFVVEQSGNYPAEVQMDSDRPETVTGHSGVSKELLARYGYEIDTSSKGIAGVIKDSLKTNAIIIKEARPDFGLLADKGMTVDSISGNSFYIHLSFVSRNAPVTGITVRSVPAVFFDEILHLAPDPGNNYFYLPVGDTLPADVVKSICIAIPYTTKGVIYSLQTGVLSNINGTQNQMVRRIYWLDTETKQFGEATGAYFKLVDNLYRKQGFN